MIVRCAQNFENTLGAGEIIHLGNGANQYAANHLLWPVVALALVEHEPFWPRYYERLHDSCEGGKKLPTEYTSNSSNKRLA